MNSILAKLLEVDGVTGAVLLSQDGLPILTANLESDEAETIGALATALLAHLRSATTRLAGGDLHGVRLACTDGAIDVRSLDELILLVVQDASFDQPTFDHVLPQVTAECLEFAL